MDTLGWVYYKKGLYDSAISEFSSSLEKIPENPIVHYHLGLAYYKKDDKTKAKMALEKALSVDENFNGAQEAKRILAGI
jgi:tetratricopeptide (TPR) repeat protein